MNPKLKKEILEWHSKGLSKFGIAQKLRIHHWEAQEIIESEIKKDFNSLFEGG